MIVMDKSAPRFDGYYVRVEMAANRKELMVGVVQGGKPSILTRYAIWNVPLDMLETARDLATTVDTFAKEQRVRNLCDMSEGIRMSYKLNPGDEVYGEQ